MNKQFQGSKKKARKAAYLERQTAKQHKRVHYMQLQKALEEKDIEESARLMGIRLK
jgi:hypothetical protein